jgi:hypothetical protein
VVACVGRSRADAYGCSWRQVAEAARLSMPGGGDADGLPRMVRRILLSVCFAAARRRSDYGDFSRADVPCLMLETLLHCRCRIASVPPSTLLLRSCDNRAIAVQIRERIRQNSLRARHNATSRAMHVRAFKRASHVGIERLLIQRALSLRDRGGDLV